MSVKVPEVKRCCFCLPLRYGIIIFGMINIMLSMAAVGYLVVTTDLKKGTWSNGSSLEDVTCTVLFSIFGMSIILNSVLLVGGFQKSISALRLYNYYAVLTSLAALVPIFILFTQRQFDAVYAALLAVVMQVYVIVLVRSEIIKLEKELLNIRNSTRVEEEIDVPDTVTLM